MTLLDDITNREVVIIVVLVIASGIVGYTIGRACSGIGLLLLVASVPLGLLLCPTAALAIAGAFIWVFIPTVAGLFCGLARHSRKTRTPDA